MPEPGLGGKANALQKLRAAGFPIPPFLVLEAAKARQITTREFDGPFRREYEAWAKAHRINTVAVRSSANVEDSADHSYAGLFKSKLDIKGYESLVAAIADVSSFQPNWVYDKQPVTVNIIIQQMVDAEVSGVAFTQGLTGNKDEIVINSNFGLGSSVVGGENCDQYFALKSGKRYLAEIASEKLAKIKGREVLFKNKATLTSKQVRLIVDQCNQVEKYFGFPQDIEWALNKGKVFILQSRPITVLPKVRVWDSSNISESYPGLVLPLTVSIVRRAYAQVYRSMVRASGLSEQHIRDENQLFESMVAVFQGRLYYNLHSWYRMAGLFPNALNNQDFLNRMIQTEGRAVSLRVQELPKSFILYYYARLIFRVLFFQREIDHFYALAERHFSALGRLPKPRTAEEAYGPVVYLEKHLLPIWSTTVDNDFLVMTYHGIFENVLQKWFKKSGLEMKNSLLAGMGYVVSAEQATTLAELAEVCFEFKDLALLMENGEFSKAADLVNSFPDLRERIENYKQKYGNRFALDLKLEAKNPLDDPGELFKIFGAYKQVSLKNIKAGQAEAAQRALVVEAKARGQLSPLRRWAFGLLLRKLRHHIRHREQMRLFRSKVFQEARLAFSALGKILAKQGLLDQPDDVFYLETEELGRYFNATLTVDALKPIVKFRKAEYASFAKSTPPVNFATSKLPKQSIPQAGGSPKGRGKAFIGLASSAGIVAGTATVLTDPIVPEKPIEILVVRHTDPGWTPIIALAKGVVVERGGLLSHAAIITRELGIPSVIGVEGAMQAIRTGDRILVDGFKGEVSIQS